MFKVYGHDSELSKRALADAHLIVDIISEWPQKTKHLKKVLDQYGGPVLFKFFLCSSRQLCEMCQECPHEEERTNVHKFLTAVHERFGGLSFAVQLELVKFVSQHKSALFEKKGPMTSLPAHLYKRREILPKSKSVFIQPLN